MIETLADFVSLAIANVARPDLKERIALLFDRFDIEEARAIIEESNRIPANPRGNQEKGAVGEAVVAAAIRRYFGQYDGTGLFDFQYSYWGDRGPDARYPARTMDIIFLKPAGSNSCTAFQIEAKNYQKVDTATLKARHLAKQIAKDKRYLNPRIGPDRPLVPVWWFLQGLKAGARREFEAMQFRVVDFRPRSVRKRDRPRFRNASSSAPVVNHHRLGCRTLLLHTPSRWGARIKSRF